MKKLFILLFLFLQSSLYCQEKILPVNISFLNESTQIPFTKVFTTPIHPGIDLGTEFNYNKNKKIRYFQTIKTCYFYHKYLAQAVGLYSEFGFEYSFKNNLFLGSQIGIGYMHTFATTKEYVLVNGTYIRKTDYGNPRLFPSLSIVFGYNYIKNEKNIFKLFIKYQPWVEFPYSPDFIPVMTHVNFHAGIIFYITFNKNQNDKI